jgi:hypothetical protein
MMQVAALNFIALAEFFLEDVSLVRPVVALFGHGRSG